MNPVAVQSMLSHVWFYLIGLMLVLYVVTDGFDLGVGILSLFRSTEAARGPMIHSIGHVWDANETWLVVLGGALFGAFPLAYATLLSALYVPVMALIAGLIMRGAAVEFRHAANSSRRIWDRVFGIGSLLAAICQGIILGKIITGLQPGLPNVVFVVLAAIGVASGYALLGATWLIKKTAGEVQVHARRDALIAVLTTVCAALILSAGTLRLSIIGDSRWTHANVLASLIVLGSIAAFAFGYVFYAVRSRHDSSPFCAAVILFISSFAGLAISLFPDIVPGKLSIADAASSSATLIFMLFGIGFIFPIMVGYNLYQYYLFRGKVSHAAH